MYGISLGVGALLHMRSSFANNNSVPSTAVEKAQPLVCPHGTPSLSAQCEARCNDARAMHTITDQQLDDRHSWAVPQFWAFFACMVLSWTGMAVVVSLSDAICFHVLGDRPQLYGQQRLWGAVGWGICSVLAGLLVDQMSRGQLLKDYSGVFYMMAALMAADLAVSARLGADDPHATQSRSVWRDVGVLFLSPAVCVFFVWCIVIGLGTALIWNFLFWHLENLADADGSCDDDIGGGTEWMKTLQGLAMGIQCLAGEIPFFFLSGAVLKRIGHVHAMSLVLLAFGVRFLLYSVLSNPWWVLPIETMQGVTFGIFMATMTSYASIVAPPGTESTLQVRPSCVTGLIISRIHRNVCVWPGSGWCRVRGHRRGGGQLYRRPPDGVDRWQPDVPRVRCGCAGAVRCARDRAEAAGKMCVFQCWW